MRRVLYALFALLGAAFLSSLPGCSLFMTGDLTWVGPDASTHETPQTCPGCRVGATCRMNIDAKHCGSAGEECKECGPEAPVCRYGECVQCNFNSDCVSPTPVCKQDHQCHSCKEGAEVCGEGVRCLDDGSCEGACDGCFTSGVCYDPVDDAHCGFSNTPCSPCAAGTPRCKFGQCAGCSTAADCATPNPICDSRTWQCKACQEIGCPLNSECLPDGSCTPPCPGCTQDGNCYTEVTALRCGAGGKTCQACGGDTPVCSLGKCVGCVLNSDCAIPTPICQNGKCLSCKDTGCPSGSDCLEDGSCSKSCAGCVLSDGHCFPVPDRDHCGLSGGACKSCGADAPVCSAGQCVGCTSSLDCASPKPICNSADWTCKSCQEIGCPPNSDCQPDGSCSSPCAGCRADGVCVTELDAESCGAYGEVCAVCLTGAPICRFGDCVQCSSDADCGAPNPVCNPATWTCGKCTDLGCPSGGTCQSDGSCKGACNGCVTSDGACHASGPDTCGTAGQGCRTCTGTSAPICRLGKCVGCSTSADCKNPTPICNTGEWVCRSCKETGCPTNSVCQADGSCSNLCVGCTVNGNCFSDGAPAHCGSGGGACVACSGTTPKCQLSQCVGCTANADCASPNPICVPGAWQCKSCKEVGCERGTCQADGSCSDLCAGCTEGTSCYPGTAALHCGPTGGSCRACSGESKVCLSGTCVGCASSSDCASPNPTCNPADHRCHGCLDLGCPANSVCQADGTCSNPCAGCTASGNCFAGDEAARCGSGGGACRACSGATPICRLGRCVACTTNDDCPASAPLCDPARFQCRTCQEIGCTLGTCQADGKCSQTCAGCVAGNQCFPVDATHCGPTGGACESCTAAEPFCLSGTCVSCSTSSDCLPPTPTCDPGTHTCKGCASLGCAANSVCQADGTCSNPCAGCTSAGNCYTTIDAAHCGGGGQACSTCSGATPFCKLGTCVACTANSDCSGLTPLCDPTGHCRSCQEIGCASGVCQPDGSCAGSCTGCIEGGNCYTTVDAAHCGPAGGTCTACSGATPICLYGQCVGCASSSDCSSPTPICNSGQWQCRSCQSLGCPANSQCLPDGSCSTPCAGCTSGGSCYETQDPGHCGSGGQACAVCSGATPVCRLGVCVGCASASDCASPKPICNTGQWQCRSCQEIGCLSGTCQADGSCAGACSGCVAGGNCFPIDALHCGPAGGACATCSGATPLCSNGVCVGCNSNSDCASPTPICNSGQWQCRSCADLGCPTNSVCRADGSCSTPCDGCTVNGTCYTTIDAAHCGANGLACTSCSGATPVCRFGSCVGCSSNSECASPTPICNSGQWACRSCIDLGCPNGSYCSAATGACVSGTCPGCTSSGVCYSPVDGAHCGPTGGACTVCSGATPNCVGGACAACATNADCGGATPICRFGACVGCQSNSDCSGSTPLCNSGEWKCRSCADLGCAAGYHCDPSGACLSGTCSGCLVGKVCYPIDAAHCGTVGGACSTCSGATPFCDSGACVACRSGSDCGGATPICRFGQCVGCSTNSDCNSPTPICNSGQWACRSCADLGCTTGSYCSAATGACVVGTCPGCKIGNLCYASNASHCGAGGAACTTCSGGTPYCDGTSCVACLSNANCGGATPVCRFGQCVGCQSNSDCSLPTPICNSGEWKCHSCADLGCAAGYHCDPGGACLSGECTGCKVGNVCYAASAAHCGSGGGACTTCSGGTPYCDGSACVACLSNANCGGATPVCRFGQCVGCSTNSECSSPTPICNSGQWACRSCADLGCSAGNHCDPSGACLSGSCTGCTAGGFCYPNDASHCGSGGAACFSCSGATPYCGGSSCVTCASNTDCASSPLGHICRFGTCVGCSSNFDCGGTTPVCNSGLWQCVACTSSTSCGGQVCNSNGSCSSSCNGCYSGGICYPLDAAHCGPVGGTCGGACSGTTPVCDGSGFCRGCALNSECAGRSTGYSCKGDGGCGCLTPGSTSDCPPGMSCNAGPWTCR
ncbi:MAG: hypothetical protein QM765_34785 [Myxococcales bacterium]